MEPLRSAERSANSRLLARVDPSWDASRVAIRLKDGRTFAGRLLEETDEKIVIEYQRGSIKMRMIFQKADVQTITRGEKKTE